MIFHHLNIGVKSGVYLDFATYFDVTSLTQLMMMVKAEDEVDSFVEEEEGTICASCT